MNFGARIGWLVMFAGVSLLVYLAAGEMDRRAGRIAAPSPTPTVVDLRDPEPSATPLPEDDCRPCARDARLLCCYPLNTVELDDATRRLLNFAFNLEGVVGEHDRLFQVTADRLRVCDRRYADADARIAKLEDDLRDLGLKLREMERARKRRR